MIKKLKSNAEGNILKGEIQKLGGDYSFIQKLKLFGTSSSKVIYISGIDFFDATDRRLQAETPFASFQLLVKALIIRININQRIFGYGISFGDIKEVYFDRHRNQELKSNFDNIIGGTMAILLNDNVSVLFEIPLHDFEKIFRFFVKSNLVKKLNYTIEVND